MFKKPLLVLVIIFIFGFLFSCSSQKDVVYLQNFEPQEGVEDLNKFEPRFKVNDIVSIFVSAYDMEAVEPFNLSTGSGDNTEAIDYIIDKDGYIDYPVLGRVELKGKTVSAAKEMLVDRLSKYLKDPIVNIRIKNFRITLLGAIKSPGTYVISGERITLLEAIGLGGDLDIKGKRDNIMVIRDIDGTKVSTRVNLRDKSFLTSPVYYLTQNDVVYVEPNKYATSASKRDGRLGLVMGVLGFLVSMTVLITN
ncbi:polysaccharide export protein [Robertkochia marina]|uniref:Polysaccharide export protein n=1 Tax=Robertkochia marina TaxID=1227945 RepID=A0A4S3M157_9FLAO|nr:polysaccharide biosynthesis/export family protein [Robertkochia marina]THD66787.1 polysaccharide export protein [Robertkochia marina]TRZ41922.1 polysaccharide export protein [Robertkochia marina]